MRSVMVSFSSCLALSLTIQPADRMEVANIALREVKLQQTMLGDKPVLETQLVNSHRKLEALGSLCESLVRDSTSIWSIMVAGLD